MINSRIIGSGFSFPMQIDALGGTELSSDNDNIRQNMMLILGTAPGERMCRPTFGCAIHDILFEPNTLVTAAKIEYEVKKSLLEFEPRISDLEVHAMPDDSEVSRMNVTISYTIRKTNTKANLVYPFYLRKEGEV
ncbi:MAG: GPW/gp25 family protein [Proteobacteria bacterium]|nr:GPW/gp25 family protein [Pseudomonadota bacterium]MBQ4359820.1 GPW/gp25 family protein [Pseudomonadota bacterium]